MHQLYYETDDDSELLATYFAPTRQAHRSRKPAAPDKHQPSAAPPELAVQQADGEGEFRPSFTSSHNEQRMLQAALTGFYRENIITDVLAPVRGGKEASVYCCQAHPRTGMDLIAAKIYRPRAFRSLRNDAPYKEGREALDHEGKAIRDARRQRALAKKTRYGKDVDIHSWIEHEYGTLKTLYDAGAAVPKPILCLDTTILMQYLGEVRHPAPTLNSVRLQPTEARQLCEFLIENVRLMLSLNRVHADLSAYNVLYWQGAVTIIDFPQAVFALSNRSAFDFLQRDLTRLADYFAAYGVHMQPQALARDLWQRFLDAEL